MNKFFEPKPKDIDLVIDLDSDDEVPAPRPAASFESAAYKLHKKVVVEEASGGDVVELDECELSISHNTGSRWRDH